MLSPEVQSAVDEIRRNKSLTKSLQAERDLWRDKAMGLQEKLDKAASVSSMSDSDRDALKKEIAELDALNDELEGAAQENTKPEQGGDASASVDNPKNAPIAPVGAEGHPTEPLTDGDVLSANGPANHPAGGSQPLMPNLAFNPDPTGARGVGDGGQPNQPAAIETAGGFVVSGGGTTQRAPGSSPESPSSSLVVPLDPDAKAPASTADLVKSGLGDSSQNALIGADGKPVQDGPGMPSEPSPMAAEAAQKQAELAEEERARREANPLNLAEPGTPIAGSKEADAEALKRRQQEQKDAQDAQIAKNNAEQGKPAPGTPGPDPVSAPVDNRSPEDRPNKPAA